MIYLLAKIVFSQEIQTNFKNEKINITSFGI